MWVDLARVAPSNLSRDIKTHTEKTKTDAHIHTFIFFWGGTPCSDGHACNVDDQQRGQNETHGTVELGKGSVIRSLGEDTRVAHVVGIAQRTCAKGRDITKKANARS